jgi:hypothetical protein
MPRRRTHAVGYVFNVAPLLLLSGEQFLSAFTRPQLRRSPMHRSVYAASWWNC